ncbi:DUF1403 family protein [Methylocystis sp. H4A]|uniref:DUF1403 family protein n=1 Tax=Methylocystis sp. H4A TaxID=2785788 RepID=UPI0018C23BD3|nr:DUF1403 family protein [Methylocystis sp. H4A]MBG0800459.1 DUF1403 family protein [Methylocystis sp. H4A]
MVAEALNQLFANYRKGGAGDRDAAGARREIAKLSNRSARRLFDRLTELGVVRELSGRSSFRLYGL